MGCGGAAAPFAFIDYISQAEVTEEVGLETFVRDQGKNRKEDRRESKKKKIVDGGVSR